MKRLQKKSLSSDIGIKRLISIILLLLATSLYAQERIPKNSAYFELGGNGLYYSFNYERIFIQGDKMNYAIRGGLGYTPKFIHGNDIFVLPVEFNIITGQNNSHFELGFGYTFVYQYWIGDHYGQLLLLRFGYRFQKKSKGLMYRLALTPFTDYFVYPNWTDRFITPFAAASIGYSF